MVKIIRFVFEVCVKESLLIRIFKADSDTDLIIDSERFWLLVSDCRIKSTDRRLNVLIGFDFQFKVLLPKYWLLNIKTKFNIDDLLGFTVKKAIDCIYFVKRRSVAIDKQFRITFVTSNRD